MIANNGWDYEAIKRLVEDSNKFTKQVTGDYNKQTMEYSLTSQQNVGTTPNYGSFIQDHRPTNASLTIGTSVNSYGYWLKATYCDATGNIVKEETTELWRDAVDDLPKEELVNRLLDEIRRGSSLKMAVDKVLNGHPNQEFSPEVESLFKRMKLQIKKELALT